MIFTRTLSIPKYSDYVSYRPFLRQDFQYRCAYCLRHEFFGGGEAGFQIDHHRPTGGPYARPDLKTDYANLYWCCTECNQNKGDVWPSPEEEAQSLRFLDPCLPEDDHDLHLLPRSDGSLEILTPVGRFTHDVLLLWRTDLQNLRRELYHCQQEAEEIRAILKTKDATDPQRILLERLLEQINKWLEPPVFDRTRPSEAK